MCVCGINAAVRRGVWPERGLPLGGQGCHGNRSCHDKCDHSIGGQTPCDRRGDVAAAGQRSICGSHGEDHHSVYAWLLHGEMYHLTLSCM